MPKKIKVISKGTQPAIDLNHIEVLKFSLSTSQETPHKKIITSTFRYYGEDGGSKYYDCSLVTMVIPDLQALEDDIENPGERNQFAADMDDFFEGIGKMAQYANDIIFIEVD